MEQRELKPTVFGVGINDADYVVTKWETISYAEGKQKQKLIWRCPHYRVWKNMLKRCYSAKWQENYPTYKGCSISEDWLTFSNFRVWMMAQYWEGKHLDKDILIEGNKIYSADTCVFVTQAVNKFTIDHGAARGEWLIGVSWHKRDGKFRANCRNPFTGKLEHLGNFTCEQEAHQAWGKRKYEVAVKLAELQTDIRVAKALVDRYKGYGENHPYTASTD